MGPHPLKADMTFYAKIPVKVNSARENRFSQLPFSIREHRVSVANKHIERYYYQRRNSQARKRRSPGVFSLLNLRAFDPEHLFEPWLDLKNNL
jgi:hypothetical protein